jgi:hypothetical protein
MVGKKQQAKILHINWKQARGPCETGLEPAILISSGINSGKFGEK